MNVQPRHRNLHERPAAATRAAPVKKRGFLAPVRKRPFVTTALVVALAAGIGYFVQTRAGGGEGTPIVEAAVRGDIEELVTALGSLTPLKSVDVGAQVSGQLDKLLIQIGDEVKQGQKLAEIEAKVTQARVEAGNAQVVSLQAQLAERESQLALATAQAGRQERLMADNATSQDAYDLAQAAMRTAQAQVKSTTADINRAQSTLKADEALLGYANIFAPMSGTVTAIPAKQGQTLNANQTAPLILTIADLSTMTVSTQVSEADVPKLRIGMDVYFTTLGSGAKRWTGKLRQILPTPTVLNNVVLYTALFDVANPTRELMPLMSAQVFFVQQGAYDVITVPVGALRFTDRGGRGGGRGEGGEGGDEAPAQTAAPPQTDAVAKPTRSAEVTVVHEDGMQEVRNVQVGVTDRVNAEIVSGLSEGENVVVGIERAGGRNNKKGNGGGNNRGPVLFGG
jgi:macrolide-specific efflux system membrane fusion protein